MKTLKTISAAVFAAILMMSCGSNKNILTANALDGEWNINSVNGTAVTADKQPYLGINMQEKRLYGNAGCNRIMGGVQADKAGELSFGQVASTRMMCPDMATERNVMEALNNVSGYKGTETELILTDKKGSELMNLTKRPTATLEALKGKWNITQVYGEPIENIEKTEKKPFLQFDLDKKAVHGNAGCNIVNGGFTQKDNQAASLSFGQMISTMMAGPGMDLERKVLEAINNVKSFMVKDTNTVILLDENGEEALTLTKE